MVEFRWYVMGRAFQTVIAVLMVISLLTASCAIGAAEQQPMEPTVVFMVFSDGSVKVISEGVDFIKGDTVENIEKCNINGFMEISNESLFARINCSLKSQEPTQVNVKIYMGGVSESKANVTKSMAGGKIFIVSEGLKVDGALEVNTFSDLNVMIERMWGNVEVSVEGKNATYIIPALAFLNKPMVEQMLQENNITWISIDELTTSIKGNVASISFNITIDLNEYVVFLENVTMVPKDGILKLITLKPEGVTKWELEIAVEGYEGYIDFKLGFHGDVKKLLDLLERSISMAFKAPMIPPMPEPSPQTIRDEAMIFLNEIIEYVEVEGLKFEILPSKARLNIDISNNTIKYYVETPKFRLADSTDPTETLKALRKLLVGLKDISEKYEELELTQPIVQLLNTTITLKPGDEHVIVEPTQVKIGELDMVKVIKKPIQITATVTIPYTTTITNTVTVTTTLKETSTVTTTKTITQTETYTTTTTKTITTVKKEVNMEVVGGAIAVAVIAIIIALAISFKRH